MSTPLDIFGVVYSAGAKLVAALYLPAGLATAAGTTIAGGSVAGTTTVTTGSTVIYLGLAEGVDTVYDGESDVAGAALPDASGRPYTVEVRAVAAATDMASYSAIAAAFAASEDVAYTRDVPATLDGGYLRDGRWSDGAAAVATGTDAAPLVTAVTRTLNNRHAVDGVLTDLTSCKLSDPTGTFGVRRLDTGATVVADGADFTHDGTGLYSYALPALAVGVAYEAYVEEVYLGATKHRAVRWTAKAARGMTLTEARGWIRQFAKNAGSSKAYGDAEIDRALQHVGERFCRLTQCLIRADSAALTAGSATLDLSGLDGGFQPDRLLSAYVNGVAAPLRLTTWEDLNRRQQCPVGSGTPTDLAFEDPGNASVDPVPDVDRTVRLRWWEPFTDWVPGVASGTADALILNLRPDLLKEILPYGPPACLQHNEPEHKYAAASWQKYLEVEQRLMGAGNLAARVSRRAMQE